MKFTYPGQHPRIPSPTTRILHGLFSFLKHTRISKFKYERKTQMNSGLSSKKMLSCKWPIASLKLLLLTMNNLPRNRVQQALPRMKINLTYLLFQNQKTFANVLPFFLPLAVIRGDLTYFHWKKCLWWLLFFSSM